MKNDYGTQLNILKQECKMQRSASQKRRYLGNEMVKKLKLRQDESNCS